MCSIRGIVSIGAIAPTIFEDIYIDTYEIFYHFHPNEEDTTKSKKYEFFVISISIHDVLKTFPNAFMV